MSSKIVKKMTSTASTNTSSSLDDSLRLRAGGATAETITTATTSAVVDGVITKSTSYNSLSDASAAATATPHTMDPLYLEASAPTDDTACQNGMMMMTMNGESSLSHSLPLHVGDATTAGASSHKLGVLPLAVIVFYSVSGGPFGVEPAVRSAGNLYSLLGFLFLPVLWSLPEAFLTAELGAAIPEAAGGVAWVETAFGPAAGWLCGYLGWISGATDNAIYPVLFLDYVVATFGIGGDMTAFERWVWLALCSTTLACINWLGLPTVGNMSMAICVLAMSPFVVLCLFGMWKVDPMRWLELPPIPSSVVHDDVANDDVLPPGDTTFTWASFRTSFSRVLWAPFLNNLFWNGNSFDSAASFSADVENPAHSFPRAMMYSVFMVGVAYFVPLLVALGASTADPSAWVDGYLAKAASNIIGPWLGGWTVFAAGVSNIAMFQAELSSDAFQLMGMADRGYLPAIFSIRSRHGTPTYGILLGTMVIVLMTLSDLDGLIEMLNFQYSISLIMEYAAFIKLRIAQPDMHRPYRIPLGTVGCILLFIPPVVMTLIIMALASWSTLLFSLVVNVAGLGIYWVRNGRASKLSYEHVVTNTATTGVPA